MFSALRCPKCNSRLPLMVALKASALRCGACGSGIEPRPSSLIAPLAGGCATVVWVKGPLQGLGFEGPGGVLAGLVPATAVWALLYLVLGRFRLAGSRDR